MKDELVGREKEATVDALDALCSETQLKKVRNFYYI